MTQISAAAMERTMRVYEVMLRTMSKQITWWQAGCWMFALFAREFPSSVSQQERRSTMDCWVRLSGRETVDFPAVAFIAAISEAVVQAALPVLPEFDRVRLEAVASPGVG